MCTIFCVVAAAGGRAGHGWYFANVNEDEVKESVLGN